MDASTDKLVKEETKGQLWLKMKITSLHRAGTPSLDLHSLNGSPSSQMGHEKDASGDESR